MWYGYHRGFLDRRLREKGGSPSVGELVFTASDDHVFLPVHQIDVTSLVDGRKVSGIKPAVANRRRRVCRAPPVANHYVRSAGDYLADLTRLNLISVVLDDANLDAGRGLPA